MMKSIKKYIPGSIKRLILHSLPYKLYLRKQMIPKIPYSMNIGLTTRCNLKCRMCSHPTKKNLDIGDIDFDLFKKIVDDVANFANKKISITLGDLGEPLMYDKLPDAIEYVKRRCPESPVIFNTNGILLDEKISNTLVKLMRGGR